MYLLSTQEHTIPLCVKIFQILFKLELFWFWIEGNGRLFSKNLSVQCWDLLCLIARKTELSPNSDIPNLISQMFLINYILPLRHIKYDRS